MKHMRKVFALALTLIMALALTLPAFAADENATIDVTIKSEKNTDATYVAYKLLDLTTSLKCGQTESTAEGGHQHSDACYAYSYKLNDKYTDVLKEVLSVTTNDPNKTLDQTIMDKLATYNTAEAARTLAEALYAQVKTMAADVTGITVGTAKTLTQGYWLIVDTSKLDNGEVRSLVMLDTAGQESLEITAKDDSIPVDKKVNGSDTYVTAHIGEVVTYTLSSKLPSNLAQYKTYTFKFVDTMDDGLDFKEIVSVKIDGVDVPVKTNDVAGYVFSGFSKDSDSGKYIATFDLSSYVTANKANLGGKDVVITYTATVNADAEVNGNPENNDVKVVYTNDYQTNQEGETPHDDVDVYSFSFDVIKFADADVENGTVGVYDEGDLLLADAYFQLTKTEGGKTYYATTSTQNTTENGKLIPPADGVYKISGWVEANDDGTAPAAAATFVTGTSGKIDIDGLAVGTYNLIETKAPEGYNLLADAIEVVIKDTAADNAQAPTVTLPTIEVLNTTGSELPATGGIGTTIFYVVGGLLMAGAIILLITKKKLANDQ